MQNAVLQHNTSPFISDSLSLSANSILSTPSPDLIEVKTKDEFLYQ